MIVDLKKLTDHLVSWIRNYAESNGIKTLVYHLEPHNLNAVLISLLCLKTGLPNLAVSYSSIPNTTKTWADAFYIPYVEFVPPSNLKATEGALLSLEAEKCKGVVVGSLNRSALQFIRNYHKYGQRADIMPLADLFTSESIDLFRGLSIEIASKIPNLDIITSSKSNIYKGLAEVEIEWADRENEKLGKIGLDKIIESKSDPAKHPSFLGYTARQKEIVCILNQIEKLTRHKIIDNLPYPKIRHLEDLVR